MGSSQVVDLNADVGERPDSWRPGDDEAILSVVSTAHIACGFHSGDLTVMAETTAMAVRLGVSVGAHPSYADREGFGRRPMDVEPARIRDDVLYQIATLDDVARAEGTRVRSVKAHGALYHRMSGDREVTLAVVSAMQDLSDDLWLVVQAGTAAAKVARSAGVRVVEEGFCDRRYGPDGTPAPRDASDALVTDAQQAAQQALRLARDREVEATDGSLLRVAADTLCLHGDTPGAASLARAVRSALESAAFVVASFDSG